MVQIPSLEHFFLHPCLNGHESWPGICLVLLGTKGAIPIFSCGPSWLLVRSHTESVMFRLSKQNEQTDSDLRILTTFRRCSNFQQLCSEEDCIQRTSAARFATLPRVRALDHANPRKGLRGAPKSCNFTSRSGARPRQSTQRVAFPMDGIGAGSGFKKIDIPRCR